VFNNAKQKLPKPFADKITANAEWKEFKKQPVIKIVDALIKRSAVLRERDNCARFIKEARKP
jgi:hypothetical protein